MDLPRIQWYPGHIAKAQRLLKDRLAVVDMVVEIADARIPASSRFKEARALIGSRPTLLVLTKPDLAEPEATEAWAKALGAAIVDGRSGQGLNAIRKRLALLKNKVDEKMRARGRLPRAARIMVVGLPNVGKSSLINRLAGRHKAPTGDKPGVTRAPGWIRLGGDFELLDTPGLISPRLEDPVLAFKLALVGAVSPESYDAEAVGRAALAWVARRHAADLATYAGIDDPEAAARLAFPEGLEELARQRGWLRAKGLDIGRAARSFLRDLQTGAIGRMTWDPPPEPAGTGQGEPAGEV